MLGAGYDQGTQSQMVNSQIGIPIPINNRNQGNQTAAQAEYCRALHELERIQRSLKSRFATAVNSFESAAASVELYRDEIVW